MRPNCLECTIKHLAQATVQMEEALMGYPLHKYLAWGHMAEASSECLENYPTLANDIRDYRKLYMMDVGYKVPIMKLLSQLDTLLADEQMEDKPEAPPTAHHQELPEHSLEYALEHKICRICGITILKYDPIILNFGKEHAHQQCLYPLGCRRCKHEVDKHIPAGCVECKCNAFIGYNIELARAKANAAENAAKAAEKIVKELPDDVPF